MAHGEFRFHGKGLSFWWLHIWTTVLTIITLGLYWPWAYTAQMRWSASHTAIDGKQLTFKGSGGGFFGNYLLITILTIVTLGIYAPWAPAASCAGRRTTSTSPIPETSNRAERIGSSTRAAP